MLKTSGGLRALLLLLLIFAFSACDDDDCIDCDIPDPSSQLKFVGSPTCGSNGCHTDIYTVFRESGHPYKLNEVKNGDMPSYPWDSQHDYTVAADGPAPGSNVDDLAWVIGGFGWKARFVQSNGLVYTAGDEAQLNLHAPDGEHPWVAYHKDEVKRYDYSCFKCHTTGASPEGSWPAGTTGFGSFVFGGVECEECHGMGSKHMFAPQDFEMTVDRSPDLCGRCHTRDSENRIAVSGGMVRHHEQYDELLHSPHINIGCAGCHDPHASVKYDDVALGEGVRADCLTCHSQYDFVENGGNLVHPQPADCKSCHMPKAAKSARKDNDYMGDIASHIFSIRTDSGGKDTMWTEDGKFVKLDSFGQAHLTLDFACYSCHVDENDVGGGTAQKLTLEQLSAAAIGMHSGETKAR